jgi:hypothetical protein
LQQAIAEAGKRLRDHSDSHIPPPSKRQKRLDNPYNEIAGHNGKDGLDSNSGAVLPSMFGWPLI